MKSISYSLIAAAAAVGMAFGADTATTNPVGYTTINCLPNSDTVVGLPLRLSAAARGGLSVVPSVNGASATLTVSGTPFSASAFAGKYYLKFATGSDAGKWFPISANTTNTITVDLNGNATSAAVNDQFEVLKFWTLAELFNPAAATTDAATTPHAIVASTNTFSGGRRTEVLLPNLNAVGTNLAPSVTYYINGGVWKKQGQGDTSFNDDQLWPDSYFIIRHPSAVTATTKYVSSGEVEVNKFEIPLTTQASGKQDNFIGLPRPIDVKLSNLGLGGTSAFLSSTSTFAGGRRDELLVFNNGVASRNKAPSATYFFHNGIWKKQGNANADADVGADIIPSGAGLIVRKYQSGNGATALWSNALVTE